jgi:hypothetical protein
MSFKIRTITITGHRRLSSHAVKDVCEDSSLIVSSLTTDKKMVDTSHIKLHVLNLLEATKMNNSSIITLHRQELE